MTEPFDMDTAMRELGLASIPQTFWVHGECADRIGYVNANSNTYMRLAALTLEFEIAGFQFDREELKAMLLYMQREKLRFKREVATIKFKVLKKAEEKGVEWTVKLDHDADQAAWRMARSIKTKKKSR